MDHPLVQSVLLPLLFTASGLAAGRWLARGREAGWPALLGLAMGLAAGLLAMSGTPVWPARSGLEKLPWLWLVVFAGAALSERLPRSRWRTTLALAATGAVCGGWLAASRLARGELPALWFLFACALAALLLAAALRRTASPGAQRPAVLVAAGLALAAVAFQAGSLALMQTALSLAVASATLALWNWPQPRLPLGDGAIRLTALVTLSLGLVLVLNTRAPLVTLAPLLAVFAAGALARRLPVPARLRRERLEPVYVLLLALLPAALALWLATPPPVDDLYYD